MRVLIIRSCAVGDFVLNLPALAALQECYGRAAEFTLVGYPATMELAREFVNVQAIHSIDQEPWRRLFYEALDGLSFDRAIVWMKDPAVADNLVRSGIRNVFRADPFPKSGHAALHLLNTLTLPVSKLPDLWNPGSTRIVLHPGSGSPKKCWPYFLQLAERLDSVAFLLGPAELDFDAGRHPCLEDLSLPEVSSLLRSARGFVGNDSGITHLAAYLGCPTIALFGPTDPDMWAPMGRRVQLLHNPDLAAIPVDAVIRGIGKLYTV